MTAEIIAVIAFVLIGLPLAIGLYPEARPLLIAGLAVLLGAGAVFAVMLALAAVHVPWTVPRVGAVILTAWVPLTILAARRRRHRRAADGEGSDADGGHRWTRALGLTFDLLSAVTVTGYVLYATLVPLWEADFWAIWGLKARVFLEAGTIDWRYLESTWNRFCHPDYPLLVPMLFDFVGLLRDGWSDRWLGIVFGAFSIACLLVLRAMLSLECSPLVSGAATFAGSSLAVSRFVGMAEGPLIAYAACSILLIRRGLQGADGHALRCGAILLGLAGSCKNEGLALLVAVVLGVLVADPRRWRRVLALWPAVLIVAPWLILRTLHGLSTDLAEGSAVSRVVAHLPDLGTILWLLWRALMEKPFWLAFLVSMLVVRPADLSRERFVLAVLALQGSFYVFSYLLTPHDLGWHVVTSWPRLTAHLALPALSVMMLMLSRLISRERQGPARGVEMG